MNSQIVYTSYLDIKKVLEKEKCKKVFVVCSHFIPHSFVSDFLKTLDVEVVYFTDFTPNPKYEEVVKGIDLYKKEQCDFLMSIGGGSAIDVAKCINLFMNLDASKNYLNQTYKGATIGHLCIPTTAGTGSEANQFAVIYYQGVKQSIHHLSLIPPYVILEPKFLESIPDYQKKSTLLDALCHAIESYWSIHSSDESKQFAKESIHLILNNMDQYFAHPNKEVNTSMLQAANLSGKAINLTQTTAAHAMSYKLTSLYGISHGHAVALCLPHIWEYMVNHLELTSDPRGASYLDKTFDELDSLFECPSHEASIEKFCNIICQLELQSVKLVREEDLPLLVESINLDRLKNNPVPLNANTIEKVYRKIM